MTDPLVRGLDTIARAERQGVGGGGGPSVDAGTRLGAALDVGEVVGADTGAGVGSGLGTLTPPQTDQRSGGRQATRVDEDSRVDLGSQLALRRETRPRADVRLDTRADFRFEPGAGGQPRGSSRERRPGTTDSAGGAFDDLLGPNYFSEQVAAFGGVGVEGRGSPGEGVLEDQPFATRAAGALPVAAAVDEGEEGEAFEAAAEFFTFGGGR